MLLGCFKDIVTQGKMTKLTELAEKCDVAT